MDSNKASRDFFTPSDDLVRLGITTEIPGLPNVLLLGDSISIGYTPFVRECLAGIANVFRPEENCGDTVRGLSSLQGWLGNRTWRVIHFNWGLWDLCYRNPEAQTHGHRDKLAGKLSVSLDDYARNLDTLVCRLTATGATLVWASTTRVPEGEIGRHVEDAPRYNAVAAGVMRRHGILVNDLYACSLSIGPTGCVGAGDVHFSEEGSRLLGVTTAAAIRSSVVLAKFLS